MPPGVSAAIFAFQSLRYHDIIKELHCQETFYTPNCYVWGESLKEANHFTLTVNSVVRYATIFVSQVHFNRRTSSEVEIIQRTLVTAEDLGIFLIAKMDWKRRAPRLITTDHSQGMSYKTYWPEYHLIW